MQDKLEFKLINNFKCKKCGCTTYDKNIYTGFKTLDEENSIIFEKYICRNCDFPFNIDDYLSKSESFIMTTKELINSSKVIDNGVENLYKGVESNE